VRLAAGLAALLLGGASRAAAEPFVPTSDSQVLERLADPRSPELRELAELQAEHAAAPDSPGPALALARRALALGQRDADPRLVGRAEAVLAPLLRDAEPPVEALVLHATVQQNRHAFEPALETLARVLERDPRNAQAWLTRATIQLVRGDPAASLRSCSHLFGPGTAAVWASVCADQARSRMGELRASYASLTAVVASGSQAPPALRAWLELTLGEMAVRLGDAPAAEDHLQHALAAQPGDVVTRAELADLWLDAGRPEQVRDLLRNETRADILILRLAIAEHALSDPAAEGHARLLEARAEEARLRGDTVHAREEGRLALEVRGDAARALELARVSFAAQREPADARLLLEAARAARDPNAAAPVRAWLASTKLEDARLTPLLVTMP
jgi:predicted Zn-dependent protease